MYFSPPRSHTNAPIGTNAATFGITNGALAIAGGGSYNLTNSVPFPLYRDRGFTGNVGLWTTGLLANASFVYQFATPQSITGTLVTNWDANPLVTNTYSSSTSATNNEYYGATVNLATTIQNCTLGRLQQIINGNTTNTLFVDPTNTYVGITP